MAKLAANRLYNKISKSFFISIASLFIISCSHEENKKVICLGSYDYGKEFIDQKENIEQAEQRFNSFVGREVVIISRAGTNNCQIKEFDIPEEKICGRFITRSGTILLDSKAIEASLYDHDRLFQATLMHELGHSFGMDHVGVHGNLMSESISLNFTEADKEECYRVGLCQK